LNFPKMLLAFQQKRQEWFDQLEKDYGTNFTKVLLAQGRKAIRPPNEDSAIRPVNETIPLYSTNRMRRKMMIKLLEAQEAARHPRSRNLRANVNSNNNSTDTTAESAQRTRQQAAYTNTHEFPKFVWATGGHRYATCDVHNVYCKSFSFTDVHSCILTCTHCLSLPFTYLLIVIDTIC
jgi:hypothetical protein